MSIRHAEYLKEEILSKIYPAVACLVAFLINEKVYQPLARSDFGKVVSVICIREEMPQVICQEQRMYIFQYTFSKQFQLLDLRIEENNHPESSPTYTLFLIDNADRIFTVNYHESFKEAQANYRTLKQLLLENKKATVSLSEYGFFRAFVLWLLSISMVWGYFLGFLAFLSFLDIIPTLARFLFDLLMLFLDFIKKIICRLFE